jgi:hypothetical protein
MTPRSGSSPTRRRRRPAWKWSGPPSERAVSRSRRGRRERRKRGQREAPRAQEQRVFRAAALLPARSVPAKWGKGDDRATRATSARARAGWRNHASCRTGLPAGRRFDHVRPEHPFDAVRNITTWSGAAVWTSTCASAGTTTGAAPVTVVLIGPMARSRPAAVSSSRTAGIASAARRATQRVPAMTCPRRAIHCHVRPPSRDRSTSACVEAITT